MSIYLKKMIYFKKMTFNPDIHVDDCVVLVFQKGNERFGEIGRLEYHDWREYGMYGFVFADGNRKEFYGGIMKDDKPSAVRVFYRHRDDKGISLDKKGKGPESFKREFLGLDLEDIEDLEFLAREREALFNESLP